MKAMILAAGLGTRLRPFSDLRPKPLFPVIDQPLLRQILARLRSAQFGPIVVNAHHLGRQIITSLADEPDVILQEEQQILGTGGGLRMALPHFGSDPILVTNGDIYHNIDYAWVYRQHQRSGAVATLVLHDYPRFNNVAVREDNRIVGFYDGPGDNNNKAKFLAFTGIHVIDPDILQTISADTFYNIIDCYRAIILQGGLIQALVATGHYWTDIGTPADYLALHAHLLKGEIDSIVPRPGALRDAVYYGDGAVVANNVRLDDWVCLGSGCRVDENVRLSRVVVWDGAHVKAGSDCSDTILV